MVTLRRPWILFIVGALVTALGAARPPLPLSHPALRDGLFRTAAACIACHNGVVSPAGEDVSIGAEWRASMMAHSARDPYWQAAVRREVIEHPTAAAAIEDECAACHMPMARKEAHLAGGQGEVFANLAGADRPDVELAMDGVSCTVCHQIAAEGLGDPATFNGEFEVASATAEGERPLFGPFEMDRGRTRLMHSATTFTPTQSEHVQSSALCASCHTLYTTALDADGNAVGRLPEQVSYLEWLASSFSAERSCQSCHMPVVTGEAPVAGVLGQPREEVSRHTFQGGNFFMLRMLNRYRNELGVEASSGELEASARRTEELLQNATARVRIENLTRQGRAVGFDVVVDNLTGHKLPTGYPARRVWLRVAVHDGSGRTLFESGAFRADGSIAGNDGDESPARWEPHHSVIRDGADVQIYEAVMEHHAGGPTTGLLNATGYLKDNRILPSGFDKIAADPDVAVHGDALADSDFVGGADRVRYEPELGEGEVPIEVVAELWYQPIAFRWARNLTDFDAPEPRRFVSWYDEMAASSALQIGVARAQLP